MYVLDSPWFYVVEIGVYDYECVGGYVTVFVLIDSTLRN